MRLFKKKDKRYNNPLDNYTNKYSGTFKLGLITLLLLTPLFKKASDSLTTGISWFF